MKFSFRLLTRLIFLFVVLGLFAVGGILAWFTSWRSDRLADLDGGSELAKTGSGEVEYVRQGDGPPLLVFHGALGGYDQAVLFGEQFLEAGMEVIAPSRPGYLRTPLADGITPEQQADRMMALLDTLGIPQVAVLGVSAGAPAAVQFAVRHPQRVRALVLISPMLTRGLPKGASALGRTMLGHLTGDVGSWLAVEAVERDPRRVLEGFFEISSQGNATDREVVVRSVLENPKQLEWFRRFVGTVAPLSPRESGTRNDLLQLRTLPDLPLAQIAAPVLVVVGADDPCLSVEVTRKLVEKIPSATLLTVAGTGHMVGLGPQAEEVNETITKFIQQLPDPAGQL